MGRDDYQERQEARRDRLYRAADERTRTADAKLSAAHRTLDMIPMGQPILVGHHSEKRHRRDIARTQAQLSSGFTARKEAADLERRADAVGTGGISSDDPEAVTKLRAELADLEIKRERMKKANAAWRKGGAAGLVALGWTEEQAAKMADLIATAYSWEKQPFPKWKVTNLGANVRRIEERIRVLSAPVPSFETLTGEGWRIEARPELNRIAITCEARLPREKFLALKGAGWRWSPTEGAFLRHLNNAGIYAAGRAAVVLGAA